MRRTEVIAKVDAIARQLQAEAGTSLTVEEARTFVWGEYPELYDQYQEGIADDQPRMPDPAPAGPPTVADAVAAAVHKQADHLAWNQWPEKTVEQIRVDLWQSPEGGHLYELASSEYGRQPLSQVQSQVRKSAEWATAWSIFERWR